ncbi:hypothetical protein JCM33374_g674 [Metschnikowia sp. JCM 33374]|nr:hypothetical protein JCM33374_g674 [Metschnikowia sp. JCM 33374]
MKSFSLGKLKTRVGRRFSEPSDNDGSPLAAGHRRNSSANSVVFSSEDHSPSPFRHRASSSFSIHSDRDSRPRSISVSKKQAKELILYETSQVIQKKLYTILKDLGLQLPIPLKTCVGGISSVTSKSIQVYVSNTHDCVYLAPSSSTSFTYEDVENGGNQIPESDSVTDLNGIMDDGVTTAASQNYTPRSSVSSGDNSSQPTTSENIYSAITSTIAKKMRASKSANYLCTQIDSQTPIPHLFAVIVELKKDTAAKTVEVEFSSKAKTQWPTSDSINRHQYEEKFKIGNLDWELEFQEADFFISLKNSTDTRSREIAPHHLAQKTKEFRLFDARKTSGESLEESPLSTSNRRYSSDSVMSTSPESSVDLQKAGLYVFLLPILLPPNIPATVNTVHGSLAHKLSVRVPGPHDRLSKRFVTNANYKLPMVRTPPSLENSTADKPIYVNRVWNDSLNYAITFPRKFVSLGSEHTINVKLVPIAKDVTVKRIKFNILERVTYVSKDLSREYEFDGDDPFARSRTSKSKERIVPLCELRTKMKTNNSGLEPFKEEVLSCPDNNLLYSCYEQRPDSTESSSSKSRGKAVMVASPLDINIALPFLTSREDKEIMTSTATDADNEVSPSSLSSPRKSSGSKRDSVASMETPSSPIIGSLETHISHVHGNQIFRDSMDEDVLKLDSSSLSPRKHRSRSECITRGYTSAAKALSPDSNFRHIQISHRLQVSFRISKPDPSDNNKMHHYEVVVDTPIILLSAKCNDGAIQLPEYHAIDTQTTQDFPSRPAAINFRTPSYDASGFSVKPFNPSNGEQLPSFEEATSAPTSPILRSSSVTSLDPHNPYSPPAYENVPPNDRPVPSEEPLTIDDVLVEANASSSSRKPSALKASLQSSFAPSSNSTSGVSSNNEVGGAERSTISSNSEVSSNMPSFDDSSSQNTRSGGETLSSNGLESSESADDSIHAVDSTSTVDDDSVDFMDSIDYDTQSMRTDDVQFDQRLPLLRNESMNGVEAQVNKISIRNRGLTSNDWSKMSTETLNGESEAQSLFHAY